MKISAIIACGGSGSRTGLNYNKLKYDIGGMPLVQKTINAFIRDDIDSIIISASKEDYDWFIKLASSLSSNIIVCIGGSTRQESIFNALNSVDNDTDYVIIHDGARPFVSQEIITNAIETATKTGSAVTCVKCVDSLRQLNNNNSVPVDRNNYLQVQTPQVFKYDSILSCYVRAREDNKLSFLDDASLYQNYFNNVSIIDGSYDNIKITTKEDLNKFTSNNCSVGCGWDTHELVENRKLILGGIEIPHTKGLLGHSDADVLIHAIMDALLSASHNRDIGTLFPDADEKFKGISSLLLLKEVAKILDEQKYVIGNISAVVMAQKPKINPYIQQIQKLLATTLNISESQITISATTTEKLGLVGHEEAISSNAYCLLYKE